MHPERVGGGFRRERAYCLADKLKSSALVDEIALHISLSFSVLDCEALLVAQQHFHERHLILWAQFIKHHCSLFYFCVEASCFLFLYVMEGLLNMR